MGFTDCWDPEDFESAIKCEIYRTLIRPVVLYGHESCTIRAEDANALGVFERHILYPKMVIWRCVRAWSMKENGKPRACWTVRRTEHPDGGAYYYAVSVPSHLNHIPWLYSRTHHLQIGPQHCHHTLAWQRLPAQTVKIPSCLLTYIKNSDQNHICNRQ